jgi:hypothetical protein
LSFGGTYVLQDDDDSNTGITHVCSDRIINALQKGMEYVVETENGNLMTIVQGITELFKEGQKVLVLYGTPSRIIADPRAKY